MLLSEELETWVREARAFAHDPAHHIDITKGQDVGELYPDILRKKIRLQGWQSAITLTYSVDRVPDADRPGEFRLLRHLACQYSIPDHITRGEVAEYQQGLLEGFTPIVKLVWPIDTEVGTQFILHQPIPVQNPQTGQVSYRTPMVWHFVCAHDGGAVPGKLAGGGGLLDHRGRALTSDTGRNAAAQPPAASRVSLAALPRSRGGLAPDIDTIEDVERELTAAILAVAGPWYEALYERQQINARPEHLASTLAAHAVASVREHWTGAAPREPDA